ncbi:hypothetical protein [Acrocarpospora sp. B8E8]|uniref:hypothetical protein n=1 Tax=Acrocarpospora sp. B8E8 TaxID=3153572 RepID=UPI00325C8FFE
MTVPSGPRSATEIRDYLIGQLNSALRRPGMFGGETALRLLLDHLVYAEHQDQAWEQERQAMASRGAFTSTLSRWSPSGTPTSTLSSTA